MAENQASLGIRPEVAQTVILEFVDEDGRAWVAGATITRLRPALRDPLAEESRQLVEGDGMKLAGFKVVI